MVLVVFLPLALVERRHENIQVDLFFLMMPAGAQRLSLMAGYLTCVGFFAILTWRTWSDAILALGKNELILASIYLVIWPAKFVLPIGFAAIGLICLRHAFRALSDPIDDVAPKSGEG